MKTILVGMLFLVPCASASAEWTCKEVKVAVAMAGSPKAALHIARLSGVSEESIAKARECFTSHRPVIRQSSDTPDRQ